MTNPSRLQTILVQVSEEIEPENIDRFIRIQAKKYMLRIDKNSRFFHSFVPESKIYQIYVKSAEDEGQIEPAIFSLLYSKHGYSNDTLDLFITDKYICIYKNATFLLLHHRRDIKTPELDKYIEQVYDIKIDNIFKMSAFEVAKLKKEFEDDPDSAKSIDFVELNIKRDWTPFIVYVTFLLLASCVYYYFVYIKDDSIEEQLNRPNTLHKLTTFVQHLNNNKILAESIRVTHSRVEAILKHKNRSKLIEFANTIKAAKVYKISYKQSSKQYFMRVVK